MNPCTRLPAMFALAAVPLLAVANDDVDALHQELSALRAAYEARIQALESRINTLESQQSAMETTVEAASAPPPQRAGDFNPAISLILRGTLADFSSPAEAAVPGFALGGESDPGAEGLSIGETELNLQANIDPHWLGNVTLAVADNSEETGVGVEEAWFQTRSMPYGLTLRGGRFFSGIGYRNEFHAHADDFVDRSLVYRVFLGGQYGDDGLQLRWLAPTDRFVELGAEWLRGDQFPAGGGAHQGKGVWDVFARTGGDVGFSHSWKAGLSWLSARADARQANDGSLFAGDLDMAVLDGVWKWAPNGNDYRHAAKFEGALLWQKPDGWFTPASGGGQQRYRVDQWGGYLDAVYKFRPQWRAGLRYSWVDTDNPGSGFAGTALDPLGLSPDIWSAMLDWSGSEFSRLRLQFNRDASDRQSVNRWYLQYIYSLGAHGAHAF